MSARIFNYRSRMTSDTQPSGPARGFVRPVFSRQNDGVRAFQPAWSCTDSAAAISSFTAPVHPSETTDAGWVPVPITISNKRTPKNSEQ